jgi:hypothetical protein
MPVSYVKDDDAVLAENKKSTKLGMASGVFIPVFLNILSILMFLRFGVILGQVGFVGMLGQFSQVFIDDICRLMNNIARAPSTRLLH